MLRKGLVFLTVIAVLGLAVLSACTTAKQDIVETAKDDGRFDTLVNALETANLTETLKGEGPYTLFAPTDEAFDKLPEGTLEALMNDIPALTDILLYHVVDGELMSDNVTNAASVTTLLGDNLTISTENETVMVNNAEVIETDIECTNGVIHVIDTVLLPPGDIIDVVMSDGRFGTLFTALEAADLVEDLEGEGPFTVFAPTDEAFNELPEGTLEGLLNDIPALTEILRYHVVAGELMSENITDNASATTLLGDNLTITTENETVMVNNAEVIQADIQCTNGVIHVINKVLTPPQDIVDTAMGDERFQTLVAALQAADLADTLKEEGPYTVFVPTVDAFNNLPEGELDALLADIPSLRDVLLYHVVPGELMSDNITDNTSATTLLGEDITFSVTDNTVMVNDAEVIEADILCTNGVIHVIDAVLVPPES